MIKMHVVSLTEEHSRLVKHFKLKHLNMIIPDIRTSKFCNKPFLIAHIPVTTYQILFIIGS